MDNNRPPNQGTISNYDAPWYDDVAAMVTALLYGQNANAQQYAGVEQFTGPQNPFNIPAQVTQGANTAVEGYNAGNYGQMAGGAGQAALAMSPLMGLAMAARAAGPGGVARRLHRAYPDEASAFHGSPQSAMRSAGQPIARPRIHALPGRSGPAPAPNANANNQLPPNYTRDGIYWRPEEF